MRQGYPRSAEYKLSSYALFMDLGLSLTRPGGVFCSLTPDSFLLGRYFGNHLSGGLGQLVVGPSERAAVDLHGRMAVVGVNRGAHRSERHGHPLHGSASKALVTDQPAGERRGRQDPHEQPHRRARVAAIERPSRLMELVPSLTLDDQLPFLLPRTNPAVDRQPGACVRVFGRRTPSFEPRSSPGSYHGCQASSARPHVEGLRKP